MPSSALKAATTSSGIITDSTGDRLIPESTRADGSTRKAIRIKPGYLPPEDVEVYKNRTAEGFRQRGNGGVVGAESKDSSLDGSGVADGQSSLLPGATAAALKNAKKRDAKKRAKAANAAAEDADKAGDAEDGKVGAEKEKEVVEAIDPNAEKEKKARSLKKKLKQAQELKEKKERGETLHPDQYSKVVKIDDLVRELKNLGFDAD